MTKPTPVTVTHSCQRAVTEYSSWRSERKQGESMCQNGYKSMQDLPSIVDQDVYNEMNNVAQFWSILISLDVQSSPRRPKLSMAVFTSLSPSSTESEDSIQRCVSHVPDLSLSLASHTHFHKKGKGLVNCVYKPCPTGMQLAG